MAFFSFSIPKAIQRAADGGRSRRPYHVYEIRITPSGVSGSTAGNESWCVYRRYNEFYRLHRRLQKQYPTVKKLDFPPKKKFGNLVRDWAGRVAGSSHTSPLCLVVRARNRNYPSPESIPIPITQLQSESTSELKSAPESPYAVKKFISLYISLCLAVRSGSFDC